MEILIFPRPDGDGIRMYSTFFLFFCFGFLCVFFRFLPPLAGMCGISLSLFAETLKLSTALFRVFRRHGDARATANLRLVRLVVAFTWLVKGERRRRVLVNRRGKEQDTRNNKSHSSASWRSCV